MTTLHDAAKQALDVLQGILDLEDQPYDPFDHRDLADLHFKALTNLREVLKQQDDLAQVAYMVGFEDGKRSKA